MHGTPEKQMKLCDSITPTAHVESAPCVLYPLLPRLEKTSKLPLPPRIRAARLLDLDVDEVVVRVEVLLHQAAHLEEGGQQPPLLLD
eukprot:4934747-Pleurochrysis_carterae.AAC.6